MKKDSYYQKLEEKGYYKTIDKRYKDYREYKEWLKYKQLQENVDKKNTIGLGDVVEKFTKATGVKKVVESITDDCGCEERKKDWNKFFSWKIKSINCIEPDDYIWLKDYLNRKSVKHTREDAQRFVGIYNYVFNKREIVKRCGSCMGNILKQLRKYLHVYES